MAEVWTALLVALVFLAAAAGFILAIWYGSLQVIAGRITAGGLLAFCLYAGQTVEPLRRLAELQGILQRSLAAAERLFELVDLPVPGNGPANAPDAVAPPERWESGGARPARHPVAAALTLDLVHFRHRESHALLEGLDLRIEPGERVALVAASGAGKSTVARLLVRFLDPSSGRILLDGSDIRTMRLRVLRRRVCVVEQDPFLFSGPLIDNIRYGSQDATLAVVEEAARLTGLETLALSRPEGLAAPLAEAGRDASGGQRQRVALARAVVRDPDLLILDEATSALDGESEAGILANLESWFSSRTVIIMAHRLSSIRRAPRIVVLQEGRVAGDGGFQELARSCAAFQALFAEQLAADAAGEGVAGSGAGPVLTTR